MQVIEYFKKGDTVFVYTQHGIKTATYVKVETDWNGRELYLKDLTDFRDEYGTVHSYYTFPEKLVFSSKEAIINFLRNGTYEHLQPVKIHESQYNVGDLVYTIEKDGIKTQKVTSVHWRVGGFEYYSTNGGCACYFDQHPEIYFHTKEDAINKLLSM